MSFVIAAPDLVQGAAQDLAGIRASLAEAAAMVVGPTTGVVPAAADEVSAAISAMFNFGQQFQALSAQAQAFHTQFVSLMNAGCGRLPQHRDRQRGAGCDERDQWCRERGRAAPRRAQAAASSAGFSVVVVAAPAVGCLVV